MNAVLLAWLSTAGGQEPEEIRELSEEVSALAAQVADARAAGASRAVLSAAMAAYRVKAEQRDRWLATASDAARDAARKARTDAARRLAEALARGTSEPDARAVLVGWLGEPSSRLDDLEAAWLQSAADPVIGPALRLDVEEQASLAGLVAAYDASEAQRAARRDRAQAQAIRARAHTGSPPTLEMTAEAERLDRDADAAEVLRSRASAVAIRAAALQERVRGSHP